MKYINLIIFLLLLTSCKNVISNNNNSTHTVDTGSFLIEVPINWSYKTQKGKDSFVGQVIGKNVELNFDYSEMGYANNLLLTPIEYLEENDWQPLIEPYYKPDVIYTSSADLIAEREKVMKEKGITDTNLVKVEPFQLPQTKFESEKNDTAITDFWATLTYKDTTVKIGIKIPDKIKQHNFDIDTLESRYYRKIIYPKSHKVKQGITGIYFRDLNSGFNFNMYALNLNLENQEKAIKAFKTIRINRK